MNRMLSLCFAMLAIVTLNAMGHSPPAAASEPVPFKGRAALVLTGATPVGDNLQLTAEATGVATHLGLFTRTETVVVNPFGVFVDGLITFTTRNGDELYAGVAGGFTAMDLSTAAGSYTFLGGTGRFQNASGNAEFSAVATETGYDITFDGKIQY